MVLYHNVLKNITNIKHNNMRTMNCVTGIEERLCQLEGLFIGSPAQGGRIGHTISIETLIDILLVLYDECCNSSLRREKTVSDFIEFGKCFGFKNQELDCVICQSLRYK